ncbi:MAG TPA: bi-domain-containing oxidoreductase [Terriglobales bacterium]|nr:bi-domain-containing oxidoreductase [Terriglobales bacterium]
MKQVLQSARTGVIEIAEVPLPRAIAGCVLVKVAASLVSAGTERSATEFGAQSLLGKARSRPDLVKQVMNKARRDGIFAAVSTVRGRLDQPSSLGYSCSGTIVDVGDGIHDLMPGDRVACAGAGSAVHAEFAVVPRLLVARLPSADIDFENAAFTTLGAVAIHAVRTAEAKLGEFVGVIGLGLLGQLIVQVLHAAGCRVIGIDPLPERVALAARMGALAATASTEEFHDLCLRHSGGYGVDSVLIAAETAGSGPVNLAPEVARDRGIVVAVGSVGMQLERKQYYEKELDFRVSRSYGPGRYDAAFEQKGRDYPIGYVRWSETRNMEAFLQLLGESKLNLQPLISHRFAIEDALLAYELITGETKQPHLAVLLSYSPDEHKETRRLELVQRSRKALSAEAVRVGLLGAGNFATGVLLPAIKKVPAIRLAGVCSANGVRARSAARKFGFDFCTTEEDQVFSDDSINVVVIASRHHLHAGQIIKALERGKNVFCEKPLCLTEEELTAIEDAHSRNANCRLMVGFNRRFAPLGKRMKACLSRVGGPFTMIYRVNAGTLPTEHWVNDPEQGGGRIRSEVCHFVDLISFLAGSAPVSVSARGACSAAAEDVVGTITFADGSIGTIVYACNGDASFSKERLEVMSSGCVAVLEDFRKLELVRHNRRETFHSWFRQDKGHLGEWQAFAECIRSGTPSPIPFEEIASSTRATIRIVDSLRLGRELDVSQPASFSAASSLALGS